MEGSNTVIDNRPSVKVFYDCDHLSEADFVSVLLGIEEEGIPYDVQAEHCSSVLELAHNASLNSRLRGGRLVISKGMALFFSMRSMDKAGPSFKIKLYQTELFRKIGANAARLVKKMPFKVLD